MGTELPGTAAQAARIRVPEPGQLDACLDEVRVPLQSPRFDRRTSGARGMLFYRLLLQAVVTEPVTYDSVVRPLRRSTQQA
jgi:hypothetical protein